MENLRLLIVTGMSGAGKTKVMQTLEDMGYFCIDNIPPKLIPKFAELCRQNDERISRTAMVVDIRGGEFFQTLSDALQMLRDMQVSYEVVFIEASDPVLISRYKETRRSHPLASSGRITTGLKKEREILSHIRNEADYIIDTSNMKPAELTEYLKRQFVQPKGEQDFSVTIVSFGFKYGIPLDADMVWDVRFLPNPFYIEEYRYKTGRVPAVKDYINSFPVTETFKSKYMDMMDFLVPQYKREGRSQLIVAVGCTGGMHRSVAMAEALGVHLAIQGVSVSVEHRDVNKNTVKEDCPSDMAITQTSVEANS